MSRTTKTIRRSIKEFFPKGSKVLIVGSPICDPCGFHQNLKLAAGDDVRSAVTEGVNRIITQVDDVTVQSFAFSLPNELNTVFCFLLRGSHSLMYMIDAVHESSKDALKTVKGKIRKILVSMYKHSPHMPPVAFLVTNIKDLRAEEKNSLSSKLRRLLNRGEKKVFLISPRNRLGVLRAFDFISDILTLQERHRTRFEWKKRRRDSRKSYDDWEKEKAESRMRKLKEKFEKKKEQHGLLSFVENENDGDQVFLNNPEGTELGEAYEMYEDYGSTSSESPSKNSESRSATDSEDSITSLEFESEEDKKKGRYSSTDPETP